MMALKSKLVGEVDCFNNLECISNLCLCEGLRYGIVKYLGGLWILFDVQSEEEETRIMSSKEIQSSLKTIQKWDPSVTSVIMLNKCTWLKIEGVPIQARSYRCFSEIGRI